MEWNQDVSAQVRQTLSENKVCLINVMGSPGTGKTSLITALIERLRAKWRIGVIEGDITGQIDAEKIAALGIPAVQLNLSLIHIYMCIRDRYCIFRSKNAQSF